MTVDPILGWIQPQPVSYSSSVPNNDLECTEGLHQHTPALAASNKVWNQDLIKNLLQFPFPPVANASELVELYSNKFYNDSHIEAISKSSRTVTNLSGDAISTTDNGVAHKALKSDGKCSASTQLNRSGIDTSCEPLVHIKQECGSPTADEGVNICESFSNRSTSQSVCQLTGPTYLQSPFMNLILSQGYHSNHWKHQELGLVEKNCQTFRNLPLLPPSQLSDSSGKVKSQNKISTGNIKPTNDQLYCHLCSYVGTSDLDFSQHMDSHFEHQCPQCDYKSRTEGRLKRHIKDFHSEDQPTDFTGGRMTRQDSNSKSRVFRCRQCNFLSEEKEEYWQHTKSHIKDDKCLLCPECPFVTEYKHHLEYHLRNHYGSKPYKCSKCNYACVNKSMLNSHMKSHTNVYQYRCADCIYATKYCHSLKLHLQKYAHKAATVLNADGSVPADGTGDFELLSKRGPPKGPRSGFKARDSTGKNDGFNNHSLPPFSMFGPAVLSNTNPICGMSAMMGSLWSATPSSAGPPPLMPITSLRGPFQQQGPSTIDYSTISATQLLKDSQQIFMSKYKEGLSTKCTYCSYTADNPVSLSNHILLYHSSESTDDEPNKNVGTTPQSTASAADSSHMSSLDMSHSDGRSSPDPGSLVSGEPRHISEDIYEILPNNIEEQPGKMDSFPLDLTSRSAGEGVLNIRQDDTAASPHASNGHSSFYYSNQLTLPPRKRARKGKAYKVESSLVDVDAGDECVEVSNGVDKYDTILTHCATLVQSKTVAADSAAESIFDNTPAATMQKDEDFIGEVGCNVNGHREKNQFKKFTAAHTLGSSGRENVLVSSSKICSAESDKSMPRDSTLPNSTSSSKFPSAYFCHHCGIAFQDCILYTIHMGYHGFQDPFKCNMCGEQTNGHIEFFIHMARKAHP